MKDIKAKDCASLQYAKNFSPVGLLHTTMQMLATITATDIHTSTGHRARDRVESVHVAQTRVETMPKAVTPEG